MATLSLLEAGSWRTLIPRLGGAREAELFHLHFAEKKSLPERFGLAASVTLDRLLLNWWSRLNQQRFW